MLLSVPLVTAVAIAAAWWPARVASRTNVVAAIGSERPDRCGRELC